MRVLALDANFAGPETNKQRVVRARYATLEVTPKQAELLAVAQRKGRIRMLVRSFKRDPSKERRQGDGGFTIESEIARTLAGGAGGGVPLNFVLMARNGLKKGQLIRNTDFVWRPMPGHANLEGLITRLSVLGINELSGSLVKKDVVKGAPIPRASIMMPTEHGFIVSALKKGMRAFPVQASQNTALGGFIAPGDRVDILLNGFAGGRAYSETIITQARVLSNDTFSNPLFGRPIQIGQITVEVTPSQAQRLSLARLVGQLSFTVRARGDTTEPPKFETDLDVSKYRLNALSGNDPSERRLRRLREENQERNKLTGGQNDEIKFYRANRQSIITVTE